MVFSMDDPILWGILPISYMLNPDNHRWGLGSYDLCFTNKCEPHSLYMTPTDDPTEDSPRSSPSDRSFLPIARPIHHLVVSSSQP